MLKDKHIMIYVTGSVAAYKAIMLMRLLQKKGAIVRVAMTKSATTFVAPLTFESLSHNFVLTDETKGMMDNQLTHIEAAQWTQLAIVVPASANFIAKMVNGISDSLPLTTLLATSAPKIVIPAMNDQMWLNPATQRNIHQLKKDNIRVLLPTTGKLAEGYSGIGRMIEPSEIIERLDKGTQDFKKLLKGKKVLVTAGGTREPIDPVRYIGNKSSGKMGYAIAQAVQKYGAEVTLISGPVRLPAPQNVKLINVVTTEEMLSAVMKEFPQNDILIMSAAVADFVTDHPSNKKIKKQTGQNEISFKFKFAPDILKEVAKIKRPDQYTVGFAAETNELLKNAQTKLKSKHLNLLVANDVSRSDIGFGSDQNQVTFLKPNQTPVNSQMMTKNKIAELLIEQIQLDL